MKDLLFIGSLLFLLMGVCFWAGYKYSFKALKGPIEQAMEQMYQTGFADGGGACWSQRREEYKQIGAN